MEHDVGQNYSRNNQTSFLLWSLRMETKSMHLNAFFLKKLFLWFVKFKASILFFLFFFNLVEWIEEDVDGVINMVIITMGYMKEIFNLEYVECDNAKYSVTVTFLFKYFVPIINIELLIFNDVVYFLL